MCGRDGGDAEHYKNCMFYHVPGREVFSIELIIYISITNDLRLSHCEPANPDLHRQI